jgi:hypothetical protein
MSPAADKTMAINKNNIHMKALPYTKEEEVGLSFSFISCSSLVSSLCLVFRLLIVQNIIAIGNINIASRIGYATLTITTEISNV